MDVGSCACGSPRCRWCGDGATWIVTRDPLTGWPKQEPAVAVWPSTAPPDAKRAPRGTWADDGALALGGGS